MVPIGCPEPSVWNYHSTLRNIPEERRAHLHGGGSLKSRMGTILICTAKCPCSWPHHTMQLPHCVIGFVTDKAYLDFIRHSFSVAFISEKSKYSVQSIKTPCMWRSCPFPIAYDVVSAPKPLEGCVLNSTFTKKSSVNFDFEAYCLTWSLLKILNVFFFFVYAHIVNRLLISKSKLERTSLEILL